MFNDFMIEIQSDEFAHKYEEYLRFYEEMEEFHEQEEV